MSYPVYIVDEFATIASKVNTAVIAQLQVFNSSFVAVNYQYGHPLEIIKTLGEWVGSQTYEPQRYPLIALFQDFQEVKDGLPGIDSTVTIHLIIANQTQPNYKAAERYANNFKPILYPVYKELLKQINYSKAFMTKGEDNLSHTKIDRLYWGNQGLYGNSANIFNDYLDVIEITNLKLKVNQKFCNV